MKLPYEPAWTQRWLNPPPDDRLRPYQGPWLLYNGMIHPIAGYAIRGINGLVAKGDALQGFEVAGRDGKFVPATATIDGGTVRVRADAVTSPESVRYGWANDPTCTLYNKAGLPAVPFEAN